MADGTKIEWTDATWNVLTGCSVLSPGCKNCYAMKLAGSRLRGIPSRIGLTQQTSNGPVWTGEVRFNEQWLDQPIRWRRGRMIFVCAHSDLFHEAVPDEVIDKVFAVIALSMQHTFQVLTKRTARMRAYFEGLGTPTNGVPERLTKPINEMILKTGWHSVPVTWPWRHVWLGASAEDQERAEERLVDLVRAPAVVRWASLEPLLGPIDLRRSLLAAAGDELSAQFAGDARIDWVVAGGESGAGARPMHPQWARDIRDQCAAAKVPFHFKQNGAWVSVSEVAGPGEHFHFPDGATVRRTGKRLAGRKLDGQLHDGMPA